MQDCIRVIENNISRYYGQCTGPYDTNTTAIIITLMIIITLLIILIYFLTK